MKALLNGFVGGRRFAPLFGTQFLGAFNDNLFKTAFFTLISFKGLGENSILPASQLLNVGALLFILPYFLFSSISGQLSTRFDKAKLARVVKIIEIVIMAVASYGFYIQSAPLLFAMLFLMGTQSTLFGPLKYAVLPDYLNDKELMMGNSLIESGTFLAILFGQIIGTMMASAPMWLVGSIVVVVAILGTVCSFYMPNVAPKNSQQIIELNISKSTKALIKETFAQRELYTAIIGISWFWLIGSVYTTQLPTFTQIHLGGNDAVFNLMLALFSIGIALGSVLCAKISKHRVQLFWVSMGTIGLTIFGTLLVYLTYQSKFSTSTDLQGLGSFLSQSTSYPIIGCMIAIGFFGGFFSVPLYTWLQTASHEAFRAQAIATNNIINAIFMVASAIFSAIVLMLFDSVTLLYLVTALGNIGLLIYLIKLDKRFIPFVKKA